jgi:hypothetical protein
MSLAETKIITEQEIKNWTDISNNVQSSSLAFAITISQDLYVRTALGEKLYEELVGQVANNTLTALNTTLLNGNDRLFRGIKPGLAWWIAYESYTYLHSKISPTGIQSKSTDQATSIDSRSLEIRKNMAKKKAEYYIDQLICYLRDNENDYPLFRDSDSCCTNLSYDGYGNSGLILDDEDEVNYYRRDNDGFKEL